MPIVEFYEKQGKVRRLDAGKSKDEVYEQVKRAFEGYI
jgi:adenylate kinase family enzyme